MALAEPTTTSGEIPEDEFRVRIAIIRATRGWNITQAADACALDPENWRRWEKTGRKPRDYEDVCRKIANGSGYDRAWISSGGPLRSRCFSLLPPVPGQMELPLLVELPSLVAV
jgi:hypothetical protein